MFHLWNTSSTACLSGLFWQFEFMCVKYWAPNRGLPYFSSFLCSSQIESLGETGYQFAWSTQCNLFMKKYKSTETLSFPDNALYAGCGIMTVRLLSTNWKSSWENGYQHSQSSLTPRSWGKHRRQWEHRNGFSSRLGSLETAARRKAATFSGVRRNKFKSSGGLWEIRVFLRSLVISTPQLHSV